MAIKFPLVQNGSSLLPPLPSIDAPGYILHIVKLNSFIANRLYTNAQQLRCSLNKNVAAENLNYEIFECCENAIN